MFKRQKLSPVEIVMPPPTKQISHAAQTSDQDLERSIAQAAVEDYLDHVCLPLVETLPYVARTEMRREVAAHLKAIADAYEEMGDGTALATQKALAKFGSPDKVARLWRESAALQNMEGSRRSKGTTRQTLRQLRRQWPGISVGLSALFLLAAWISPLHTVTPVPVVSVSPSSFLARQGVETLNSKGSVLSVPGFRHMQATQDRNCLDCHRSQTDQSYLLQQTQQWMDSRQINRSTSTRAKE